MQSSGGDLEVSRRYLGLKPPRRRPPLCSRLSFRLQLLHYSSYFLPSVRPSVFHTIYHLRFFYSLRLLFTVFCGEQEVFNRSIVEPLLRFVQCYLIVLNIDFDSFHLIKNNATGHQCLSVQKTACQPFLYLFFIIAYSTSYKTVNTFKHVLTFLIKFAFYF